MLPTIIYIGVYTLVAAAGVLAYAPHKSQDKIDQDDNKK